MKTQAEEDAETIESLKKLNAQLKKKNDEMKYGSAGEVEILREKLKRAEADLAKVFGL